MSKNSNCKECDTLIKWYNEQVMQNNQITEEYNKLMKEHNILLKENDNKIDDDLITVEEMSESGETCECESSESSECDESCESEESNESEEKKEDKKDDVVLKYNKTILPKEDDKTKSKKIKLEFWISM